MGAEALPPPARPKKRFSAMDYIFSDDEDEDAFADLDKPIDNFETEWADEEKSADGMLPGEGVPAVLKADAQRVREGLRGLNQMTSAEDYIMKIDTSLPLKFQRAHIEGYGKQEQLMIRDTDHVDVDEDEQGQDDELRWWTEFLTRNYDGEEGDLLGLAGGHMKDVEDDTAEDDDVNLNVSKHTRTQSRSRFDPKPNQDKDEVLKANDLNFLASDDTLSDQKNEKHQGLLLESEKTIDQLLAEKEAELEKYVTNR